MISGLGDCAHWKPTLDGCLLSCNLVDNLVNFIFFALFALWQLSKGMWGDKWGGGRCTQEAHSGRLSFSPKQFRL